MRKKQDTPPNRGFSDIGENMNVITRRHKPSGRYPKPYAKGRASMRGFTWEIVDYFTSVFDNVS